MAQIVAKASNLQFQHKLDRLQREFEEMIAVDARPGREQLDPVLWRAVRRNVVA